MSIEHYETEAAYGAALGRFAPEEPGVGWVQYPIADGPPWYTVLGWVAHQAGVRDEVLTAPVSFEALLGGRSARAVRERFANWRPWGSVTPAEERRGRAIWAAIAAAFPGHDVGDLLELSEADALEPGTVGVYRGMHFVRRTGDNHRAALQAWGIPLPRLYGERLAAWQRGERL